MSSDAISIQQRELTLETAKEQLALVVSQPTNSSSRSLEQLTTELPSLLQRLRTNEHELNEACVLMLLVKLVNEYNYLPDMMKPGRVMSDLFLSETAVEQLDDKNDTTTLVLKLYSLLQSKVSSRMSKRRRTATSSQQQSCWSVRLVALLARMACVMDGGVVVDWTTQVEPTVQGWIQETFGSRLASQVSAGLALAAVDLLESATAREPTVDQVTVTGLTPRHVVDMLKVHGVVNLLESASSLPCLNLMAHVADILFEYSETYQDDAGLMESAVAIEDLVRFSYRNSMSFYLKQLSPPQDDSSVQNKERKPTSDDATTNSRRDRILSNGYPCLVRVKVLLLNDQLERARDLARDMEQCSALTYEEKQRPWAYIMDDLRSTGQVFLDGNDRTNLPYLKKRNMLLTLRQHMGVIGVETLVDFYKNLVEKVETHPNIAVEEKKYITTASQQTVLRQLMDKKGVQEGIKQTLQEFPNIYVWQGKENDWALTFLQQANAIPQSLLTEDGQLDLTTLWDRAPPVDELEQEAEQQVEVEMEEIEVVEPAPVEDEGHAKEDGIPEKYVEEILSSSEEEEEEFEEEEEEEEPVRQQEEVVELLDSTDEEEEQVSGSDQDSEDTVDYSTSRPEDEETADEEEVAALFGYKKDRAPRLDPVGEADEEESSAEEEQRPAEPYQVEEEEHDAQEEEESSEEEAEQVMRRPRVIIETIDSSSSEEEIEEEHAQYSSEEELEQAAEERAQYSSEGEVEQEEESPVKEPLQEASEDEDEWVMVEKEEIRESSEDEVVVIDGEEVKPEPEEDVQEGRLGEQFEQDAASPEKAEPESEVPAEHLEKGYEPDASEAVHTEEEEEEEEEKRAKKEAAVAARKALPFGDDSIAFRTTFSDMDAADERTDHESEADDRVRKEGVARAAESEASTLVAFAQSAQRDASGTKAEVNEDQDSPFRRPAPRPYFRQPVVEEHVVDEAPHVEQPHDGEETSAAVAVSEAKRSLGEAQTEDGTSLPIVDEMPKIDDVQHGGEDTTATVEPSEASQMGDADLEGKATEEKGDEEQKHVSIVNQVPSVQDAQSVDDTSAAVAASETGRYLSEANTEDVSHADGSVDTFEKLDSSLATKPGLEVSVGKEGVTNIGTNETGEVTPTRRSMISKADRAGYDADIEEKKDSSRPLAGTEAYVPPGYEADIEEKTSVVAATSPIAAPATKAETRGYEADVEDRSLQREGANEQSKVLRSADDSSTSGLPGEAIVGSPAELEKSMQESTSEKMADSKKSVVAAEVTAAAVSSPGKMSEEVAVQDSTSEMAVSKESDVAAEATATAVSSPGKMSEEVAVQDSTSEKMADSKESVVAAEVTATAVSSPVKMSEEVAVASAETQAEAVRMDDVSPSPDKDANEQKPAASPEAPTLEEPALPSSPKEAVEVEAEAPPKPSEGEGASAMDDDETSSEASLIVRRRSPRKTRGMKRQHSDYDWGSQSRKNKQAESAPEPSTEDVGRAKKAPAPVGAVESEEIVEEEVDDEKDGASTSSEDRADSKTSPARGSDRVRQKRKDDGASLSEVSGRSKRSRRGPKEKEGKQMDSPARHTRSHDSPALHTRSHDSPSHAETKTSPMRRPVRAKRKKKDDEDASTLSGATERSKRARRGGGKEKEPREMDNPARHTRSHDSVGGAPAARSHDSPSQAGTKARSQRARGTKKDDSDSKPGPVRRSTRTKKKDDDGASTLAEAEGSKRARRNDKKKAPQMGSPELHTRSHDPPDVPASHTRSHDSVSIESTAPRRSERVRRKKGDEDDASATTESTRHARGRRSTQSASVASSDESPSKASTKKSGVRRSSRRKKPDLENRDSVGSIPGKSISVPEDDDDDSASISSVGSTSVVSKGSRRTTRTSARSRAASLSTVPESPDDTPQKSPAKKKGRKKQPSSVESTMSTRARSKSSPAPSKKSPATKKKGGRRGSSADKEVSSVASRRSTRSSTRGSSYSLRSRK